MKEQDVMKASNACAWWRSEDDLERKGSASTCLKQRIFMVPIRVSIYNRPVSLFSFHDRKVLSPFPVSLPSPYTSHQIRHYCFLCFAHTFLWESAPSCQLTISMERYSNKLYSLLLPPLNLFGYGSMFLLRQLEWWDLWIGGGDA